MSRLLVCFFFLLAMSEGFCAPIHEAVKSGNVNTVVSLIEQGVSLDTRDSDGLTPLHVAASKGHKEIALLLLEKGADVKAQDKDGLTPLHVATSKGHKEIVALLVEKGRNVKANKNRFTQVIAQGRKVIVAFLVEKGAYVKGKLKEGLTLLHQEVKVRKERIQMLMKTGGEAEVKAESSETGGKD